MYRIGIKMDMWIRAESPQRDPHIHGHLIFDKSEKAVHWKKDNFFQLL